MTIATLYDKLVDDYLWTGVGPPAPPAPGPWPYRVTWSGPSGPITAVYHAHDGQGAIAQARGRHPEGLGFTARACIG